MDKYDSSSGAGVVNEGSEILLKLARPDIYRINAFRVLEIPVTASPRAVSSQMRKLELMKKLGVTEQIERGLLPLIPLPDSSARREAYQRLADPESRLVDELFWFWSLQSGLSEDKDDALVAMKRNDFSEAVSIWKEHEEKTSEANVSMHNLAIMYHALALDIEYVAATQVLSKNQVKQKQLYWEQAFSRWQILLNHEGFWQRLTRRIRELDDPRLTTGTARRIRAGLPLAILSINAMLAVEAAQQGDNEGALYHVKLMNKSGFDKATVDEALRGAITPIRARIKVICTNAETETQEAPAHADEVVRRVMSQTSQLLATLDTLLPEEHATRESAHDEVASRILSSQIAFANKTEDWQTSLELLEQALTIAVSASVRRRIEENIEIVKSNLEYGTCWFCKERPAEDNAAAEVKMYGDVTRTPTFEGTHIEWRKLTIKVPRCSRCKAAHTRSSLFTGLGAILFGLAGLGGCFPVTAEVNWFVGLLTFGAGIAAGSGIGYFFGWLVSPKGVKSESIKNDFPHVKEMQSQGWAFGDKPSGT